MFKNPLYFEYFINFGHISIKFIAFEFMFL
jgi:hypothetical protein